MLDHDSIYKPCQTCQYFIFTTFTSKFIGLCLWTSLFSWGLLVWLIVILLHLHFFGNIFFLITDREIGITAGQPSWSSNKIQQCGKWDRETHCWNRDRTQHTHAKVDKTGEVQEVKASRRRGHAVAMALLYLYGL